jgi:hypothetical protein
MKKLLPWIIGGVAIYLVFGNEIKKIVTPKPQVDPPPNMLRGVKRNVAI